MSEPAGFAKVYAVELLCEAPPRIESGELLARIRDRVGACGLVDPDARTAGLNFHFPQHRTGFKTDSVPAQCVVGLSPRPVDDRFLTAALDQSWDWKEARAAVAIHRCTVVVSDLLASGLPYQERLDLFQDVLLATLEVVPACALLWRPCGRLVEPTAYRRSHRGGEAGDPLYGPLNVRMFTEGDEVLMDTLGLSALGLPDLQSKFSGGAVDPNTVAGLLHGAARYVYGRGDVLKDGDTVPGPSEARWECRRTTALAPPARAVVEVLAK
jgi:hypothetical protein